MPRQTRDTALPKPPPAPIDWERIAQSGRVWEFIEGEDFNGKVSSFRARIKTAARKVGVDFESVESQRDGKVVLKILARKIGERQHAPQPRRVEPAAPPASAESASQAA